MTTLFDNLNRVGGAIENALARVREEMTDLDAKREILRDALMSVDAPEPAARLRRQTPAAEVMGDHQERDYIAEPPRAAAIGRCT